VNFMSLLQLSVDEMVNFIEPRVVFYDVKDVSWTPNVDRMNAIVDQIIDRMKTTAKCRGIDTSTAPSDRDVEEQSDAERNTFSNLESRLSDAITAAQSEGDWEQVKEVASVLAQTSRAHSNLFEALDTINRGLRESLTDTE